MFKISKTQKEIFDMLIYEGLTQKQIADRRQTSKQAVSKIVKKLKKKGYLKIYKRGGLTKLGTVAHRGLTNFEKTGKNITFISTGDNKKNNKKQVWRYHALEFEVRPYYFTDKYYKLLKKRGCKSTKSGNWKYSIYYKKIIIWLESGKDFQDQDRDTAVRLATLDFNKEIVRIAKDTGFRIFKDRRAGIKLLKHHLSKTNAPEYDIITEKDMYVQFRRSDGKVFLQYDRSRGMGEREYIKDSVTTADKIEPYFQDLEKNQPLTNSQLQSRIVDLVSANEKMTKNIGVIYELIKGHFK